MKIRISREAVAGLVGCLALGLSACSRGPDERLEVSEASLVQCGSLNNGAFAVVYSNSTSAWNAVIAQAPAFVVLADDVATINTARVNYFKSRNAAIKVLTYIPMNYGNNGSAWNTRCGITTLPDGACTNTPKSWNCGAVPISTRIANAMAAGYDGVFFDETPVDKPAYVASCAASVKSVSATKLVIMNPGTVPPLSMFSDNVDIVSVEHAYTADLRNTGIPSWRWLAVEDGVSKVNTAKARLTTFRKNGGYWYYAASAYTAVPSWFPTLAAEAKKVGPSCNVVAEVPRPLGVYSFNRANDLEIPGLYTTVSSTAGTVIQAGFTPMEVNVLPGSYNVTLADYGAYTFHHWDDQSTAQPRTVTVNSNSSALMVSGWYTVQ